jgi:hypothetical protein
MSSISLMPRRPRQERFVTDEHGKRVAVIVDLDRYEKLLQAAEELEDLRAFDEARASGEPTIPFEEVVRQIEHGR